MLAAAVLCTFVHTAAANNVSSIGPLLSQPHVQLGTVLTVLCSALPHLFARAARLMTEDTGRQWQWLCCRQGPAPCGRCHTSRALRIQRKPASVTPGPFVWPPWHVRLCVAACTAAALRSMPCKEQLLSHHRSSERSAMQTVTMRPGPTQRRVNRPRKRKLRSMPLLATCQLPEQTISRAALSWDCVASSPLQLPIQSPRRASLPRTNHAPHLLFYPALHPVHTRPPSPDRKSVV